MELQAETKKVTQLRHVFTVVERNGRSFWVRIGTAFTNRDGSETVYLDALPVNGKLQIRIVEPKNGNQEEV
jgi:hypothetical protein